MPRPPKRKRIEGNGRTKENEKLREKAIEQIKRHQKEHEGEDSTEKGSCCSKEQSVQGRKQKQKIPESEKNRERKYKREGKRSPVKWTRGKET